MTTLILDEPDYKLSIKDELLHVAHPELTTQVIPINGIERLVLGKGILFSTDLPLKLASLGKELVLLGQRISATIVSPIKTPNGLRLLQYQVATNEQIRTRLVEKLLDERRNGQNRVLRRLGRQLLPALSQSPSNYMLQEAAMSRQYWHSWAECFGRDGFTERSRRPPLDPLNALLSLTSTLEDQALIPALLAEGFDLTIGIHHVTGYQRASLVLDIKELTRAELEAWIVLKWQQGFFAHQHFEQTPYGCRLTREGQQRFYPAWFRWQKRRKTSLRRLIRLCRRVIERECQNG